MADLLRRVQRFWRRAGLDDLQAAANLLTHLVDTCPVPPACDLQDPGDRNRLLADVLDEGIRQLEEARWLIDLQEAVLRRPRDAREAAIQAVRDGRAHREAQRASVIAGLRSKADGLWTRDLESALDHNATEIARDIRHQLLRGLFGDAGRAAVRDDLRKWCAGQVSCGLAVAFEQAVASAQALAVGLVEKGQRECREQVTNPNDELQQLFADGAPLSGAPDPWQPLGDVPIPELDDLSVPPIGLSPGGRSWGLSSFVARLPGFVGRLAFIARLRREVAFTAASVATELAERLRQHLHACIQRVDLVSAAALDRSVRRVETLLGRGTHADPLAASAVRSEWTSLVGRLRQAQASLLQGVPIPESVVRQEDPPDDRETTGDAEPDASKAPVADPSACPVCASAAEAVFSFLCHHHHATAAEGDERRAFLQAGGLCPSHTWQLEVISAPRGLSVTYPPLLDFVAERLRSFSTGPPPLPAMDSSACDACRARRAADEQVIGSLVASLGSANPGTEAALQTCQFHLSAILGRLPPERAAEVLAAAADRLARLAYDMREYALKLDALRGSRLTAEESQAYLRALAFFAGERRVF